MSAAEIDTEILRSVFAARVALARKTEDQALNDAAAEWRNARTWIASASRKEGSFEWCCVEFDLDPGAVRRALQEPRV